MILPQSEILRQDAGRLRIALTVDAELACFNGHFEHQPILPGIVLIGWCLHYATAHLNSPASPTAMRKIKFFKPVTPGQHLFLDISYAQGQIEFSYSDDAQQCFAAGTLCMQDSNA